MSSPRAKTSAHHDPFGLLKAILIGLALGFIAVMVVPYVLPVHERTTSAKPLPASTQTTREGPGAVTRAVPLPRLAQHSQSESPPPVAKGEPKTTATVSASLPTPPPAPAEDARHEPEADKNARAPMADKFPAPAADKSNEAAAVPSPESVTEAAKPVEPALIPAVQLSFPKPFSEDDMNGALQPLLTYKISNDDAAAIKEVLAAATRGDDGAARASIAKIADPAAKTFAEFKRLRASNADFDEVLAYGRTHPLFPAPVQDAGTEKSLFLSKASSADVLKFYANRSPLTAMGKASLGAALIDTGERERGISLIRFAWRRYPLDTATQERFQARFSDVLAEDDHALRKAMLAARARRQDDKQISEDNHKGGLKAAARLRARSGKGQSLHGGHHAKASKHGGGGKGKGRRRSALDSGPRLANATVSGKAGAFEIRSLIETVRLKKEKGKDNNTASKDNAAADVKIKPGDEAAPAPSTDKAAGVDGKPSTTKDAAPTKDAADVKEKPATKTLQEKTAENAFKLSEERAGSPAGLLSKLKALRREHADDDLWSLLRSIDPNTADIADPDHWWDFRHDEIRHALSQDHPKTAYAIAVKHGPLDDENRGEAEFFAGWIALRFLDDPKKALPHFESAHTIKGIVRDEARSAYWLGRAAAALGRSSEADAYYKEAAARFYTFYGSLAREAMRKGSTCDFRAPPLPSKAAIETFTSEDAFKAVLIIKQLDLQPYLVNFILDLARQVQDPEQMTLLLELAERVAPPHVAVRAAKIALLRGFAVEAYAFPALLPKFDPAGGNTKIEMPLLNALTRQESEFNTGSVSRVGARGLMQLMPQTAKLVATSSKLKYELPRLISDPSYNVTLGSAFLASLISGYDGSYVLALAAYNAGPGRVTQWIKDFGDPRDKSVDPIDWIERIPFTETRHYVQRILESTQIYRCRFDNNKGKFQIVEDLHRGRPGRIPNFAEVSGSAELEETP